MKSDLENYLGPNNILSKIDKRHSEVYCLLKPDGYKISTEVYKVINDNDLTTLEIGNFYLTREDVILLYPQHQSASFLEELISYMTSERVSIIRVEADLHKNELFNKLFEVVGGTHPKTAKSGTIRQLYGKESETSLVIYNVIHSPNSDEEESRLKVLINKYLKNVHV